MSSAIALIAALTPKRVIGLDNDLPWHIPADLRHFRRLTLGKPVIMGRRNHLAIGRPLPQRTNIVLSRDPNFQAPGCLIARSPEQALALAGDVPEVMIIGGAEIYRLYLPLAQRLYLTWVLADIAGDTLFPAFDPADWRLLAEREQPPGPQTAYPLRFQTLERRTGGNGAGAA